MEEINENVHPDKETEEEEKMEAENSVDNAEETKEEEDSVENAEETEEIQQEEKTDTEAELLKYRQMEQERLRKKEVGRLRMKKAGKAFLIILVFAFVAVLGGYTGSYLYAKDRESVGGNENTKTQIIYQSVLRQDENGNELGTLSIKEISDLCSPSVVEITTKSVTQYWNQTYTSEGAGSGVIYTEDGYIITNNHVIRGASTIGVILNNGEYYDAELIAADATMDLAIIKINANNLVPAVFAQDDSTQVGDTAIAIGNPLGSLGGSVTDGIVSALDREITLDNEVHNLLQTNAQINPGNSGGGLFNDRGELIGIVVAKSTYTQSGTVVEGIGFAIPIRDVRATIEDLMTRGYVSGRVYLGVGLTEIADLQTAKYYGVRNLGVYITMVEEGSPADEAGLQENDFLVSIDGQQFTTVAEMKEILNEHEVGDSVEIILVRGSRTLVTHATLSEKTE